MKIRTQILATLGAVALAPAIGLGLLTHAETCRDVSIDLDNRLRSAAERTAARVDAFMLARLEEVRSLATLPAMQGALDPQARTPAVLEQVRQILTILEARDPVNSVAFGLVDDRGEVLVDAEASRIGREERDSLYFQRTHGSRLPWANHEPWGDESSRSLLVASPVRNAQGEPVGVLRLVLENATLQQLLSSASSSADDHDLALFDQDERLIADAMSPTSRHLDLHMPKPLAGDAAPTPRDVRWLEAEGGAWIDGRAAFTPVRHANWRVMAWQPKHAHEAAVSHLGLQRLRMFGLFVLLLTAAAWAVSRRIARPIQRLERAATAIADGDLEAEIPRGTGEIGTLGATMQTMRERLLETMHQLRQAAHDAQSASAAKSQFLANMSHELRTPLTAILGFAELLAGEAANGDHGERARQAATIHRNALHLLGLVNEVLDLAKVESGTMDIRLEDTAPLALVRGIVDLLHVQARDKGLALHCRIGDVPEAIRTDPHRLKQILLNLLGNALKFTEQGVVELSIEARGDPRMLVCSVTDTGPGIAPEHLAGLFEPFAQVDSGISRRHGGTGLGLAISRQLARRLGGDLVVHSEFGEGSTFVLTVPAIDAVATPAADPSPAAGIPWTRLDARILVVEDGADNRHLLRHILTRAGASVTLAEDGLQGLAALCRDGDPQAELAAPVPFDLVLMDMQMPVLDGLAATRRLRELGLEIPVIALTAHAMDEAREQCLAAGCDEWATKPIAAATLLAICTEWLGRVGNRA